VQFNRQNHLKN